MHAFVFVSFMYVLCACAVSVYFNSSVCASFVVVALNGST